MEVIKHIDILNTMAADDQAPLGAGAPGAMAQITKDMSINQVYILTNIL